MQKIKILSENLSNQIAAGEVVERPVSIVKELVENSIDAGSSKIEISIRDGGKGLIRVADNGEGMSRDDALLSLERHATSKIEESADLFNITTMGFRGEALASIASVSRMTLATKERDAVEGTELIVDGGSLKDVRAAGIPAGTIITVSDIFFNTPARRKFLKTTTTETGHISDYVIRTALAFPSIAFTLRGEKGDIHDFPSGRHVRDRLTALFGSEDSRGLVELEAGGAGLRLSGFISPPAVQRSTATGLYLYVNGRFVRDKVMRHALLQGYSSYIMRGKYPLAIIFLEVEPAEVDVNVHPAKNEVRFRNSRNVHELVSSAVEGALRKKEWLPREGGEGTAARIASVREAAAEYVARNESLPLTGGYSYMAEREPSGNREHLERPPAEAAVRREEGRGEPVVPEAEGKREGYFSSLTVIGQLGEMYILCQAAEGLVVIDQHAAYERMAFEELKRAYSGNAKAVQELLIPETFDVTPKEAAALEENMEEVRMLGFDIEHFGGRSFVIKGVPSILGTASVKGIITGMASELSELPASKDFDNALDSIIKRIACHSVVRGRRRMNHDEMRDLLKRMDASGVVPHCPHGRPAHISFPISEIEKRFERI